MTQVGRLLTLGFLLTIQPSGSLPNLPSLSTSSECRQPEQGDKESLKNGFVGNDHQLCRPFVSTQNPQVVRVISLVALPGPGETIRVQAQICTGVVIGPRTVLTAKHCFETEKGEVDRVIAGFVKTLGGGLYPTRLRSPDPREDIMMLTVSEPMGIQPAPISPRGSSPTVLSLQGYGCLHESTALPFELTALPLQRSGTVRYVVDNMLYMSGCVCHGDSGGPVFDDEGRLVALMIRTDNHGVAGRGLLVHNFLNAP